MLANLVIVIAAFQIHLGLNGPVQASLQQRYRQAIVGLRFEEHGLTHCYWRVHRGNKLIEYPENGTVERGITTLRLAIQAPSKPGILDVAALTVVDPLGRFQFRMMLGYFESEEILIFDPIKGEYLIHISGVGFGERVFTYRSTGIEEGKDLGVLRLPNKAR